MSPKQISITLIYSFNSSVPVFQKVQAKDLQTHKIKRLVLLLGISWLISDSKKCNLPFCNNWDDWSLPLQNYWQQAQVAVLSRVGQGKLQCFQEERQIRPSFILSLCQIYSCQIDSVCNSTLSYGMYLAYLNPYRKIHANPQLQFKITNNNKIK